MKISEECDSLTGEQLRALNKRLEEESDKEYYKKYYRVQLDKKLGIHKCGIIFKCNWCAD